MKKMLMVLAVAALAGCATGKAKQWNVYDYFRPDPQLNSKHELTHTVWTCQECGYTFSARGYDLTAQVMRAEQHVHMAHR